MVPLLKGWSVSVISESALALGAERLKILSILMSGALTVSDRRKAALQ